MWVIFSNPNLDVKHFTSTPIDQLLHPPSFCSEIPTVLSLKDTLSKWMDFFLLYKLLFLLTKRWFYTETIFWGSRHHDVDLIWQICVYIYTNIYRHLKKKSSIFINQLVHTWFGKQSQRKKWSGPKSTQQKSSNKNKMSKSSPYNQVTVQNAMFGDHQHHNPHGSSGTPPRSTAKMPWIIASPEHPNFGELNFW